VTARATGPPAGLAACGCRAGGRHPNAVRTVVRLTRDALNDLDRLMRKGDPQVVRWALKKMIHLEQNPEAGEALLGGLMGWRKITVGDRDWRLVWRVTHDDTGTVIVDVAEVWAFGARSDAEVYKEMEGRIATAPQTLHTKALADVLATLGRLTNDLGATPESAAPEPPPKWLRESLLYVVRLPADEVDAMNREAAEKVWLDYTTGQGR
jgi:mRNA interferase RelE/StbE